MGRVLGEHYTALLVTGTWPQVQYGAGVKKGLNVGGGNCRRESADRMSSVRIDCDNAGIKYSKVRLQKKRPFANHQQGNDLCNLYFTNGQL